MKTQETRSRRGPLRSFEWLLGIVGGIAAFLGLFIMFGPEDSSVSVGGVGSWRVGDIASGWSYGLVIGGVLAAVGVVALVLWDRRHPAAATRERSVHADLYAHATAFALVNAFVWIQDVATGGGVDYAYWITIPWAIGLAAHASAELWQTWHQPLPH